MHRVESSGGGARRHEPSHHQRLRHGTRKFFFCWALVALFEFWVLPTGSVGATTCQQLVAIRAASFYWAPAPSDVSSQLQWAKTECLFCECGPFWAPFNSHGGPVGDGSGFRTTVIWRLLIFATRLAYFSLRQPCAVNLRCFFFGRSWIWLHVRFAVVLCASLFFTYCAVTGTASPWEVSLAATIQNVPTMLCHASLQSCDPRCDGPSS